MQIADYTIMETVYQGRKFLICRGMKNKNGASCIIKALKKKSIHHVKTVPGLQAENELLSLIDSENVIKPLEWIDDKEFTALVLEDINGRDITGVIRENPLPVNRFMDLALNLTGGLAAIHRQGIIHQDICPANIVWNPESSRIQIIDFDIASRFGIKMSYVHNIENLQGSLAYISPEQTGRMNRTVDHRTDLYSLGATFYEMLTGNPPFVSKDPMEVIYAHLARTPEPPRSVNGNIPELLSELVMKLLSKNAEDRYQSVEGLHYDLKVLQKAFQRPETTGDVTLGVRDYSGKLQIPEKLFGREKEIGQLLDAYHRVSRGEKELLLVAGYSGTGKTALVNEIHKSITRNQGYFISGKFDQLHRTVPYSAFIGALTHFCQLVLAEKADVMARWKRNITEAAGDLGKILTDIVPGLALIIGEQPDVPEVNGEEAEKRFNYIFQRFFRVLSSRENPLVLFIDDLQWADLASLKLLKVVMEDKQNKHVLIIGAYRDNEVSASHPMMTTVEDIGKDLAGELVTIPVGNLSLVHVRNWLRSALQTNTTEEVQDLAALIHEKTQGNAFFTIQFLENLYKENLLRFDFDRSGWVYSIEEIKGLNITDNVVDLLAGRIRTLPERVQEDLKLAACIGNDFDLYTLSLISETDMSVHKKSLETALIERLVYPLDDERYKFVHDRIQQAAYSLTADEDKKPLHVKIGRLLLKQSDMFDDVRKINHAEQQIFTIANHFNIGIELITDLAEKLRLADINRQAGQHARMSGAYIFALDYIQNAMRLLPADSWLHYYDQTLAIHNEAIQVCYLCGKFEEMEDYVKTTLDQAFDMHDTRVAYEFRMNSYISQNLANLALETLIEVFNKLGVTIPEAEDVETQTNEMMLKIEHLLSGMGTEGLKNLPLMNDPEKELALRFFGSGMSAMIYAGPHLLPLITYKMMALSLKSGFTPDTPFVFVTYGMMRSSGGDTAGAYEIGEITLDLMARMPENSSNTPKIKYMIITYLLGWKEHYKDVAKKLEQNCHHALNVGDHEYASYCMTNAYCYLSCTDTDIQTLEHVLQTNHDVIVQIEQPVSEIFSNIELALIATLAGKKGNPAKLEITPPQGLPDGVSSIFDFSIATRKIALANLFDNTENLEGYLAEAEQAWPSVQVPIVFWKVDLDFTFPMAFARLYPKTEDPVKKEAWLKRIQDSVETLAQWADFGPVNFRHKYQILKGELCRITGETDRAAKYYDMAVETAFENNYINEAAIANELAAKLHLEENRKKLAGFYFREARNCYEMCGLKTKVKHLEDTYPQLVSKGMPGNALAQGTISTATSESTGALLDIGTILKASHTLSGEVQLKSLLKKMMQILIENAGARRGLLIESKAGELLVQAEGTVNTVSDVVAAMPLAGDRAPLSLINYVVRSKQQIVSDNLLKDPDYAKDDYIQAEKLLSVVCFPVLRKSGSSFILYLENNLVEGAFTPSRLEVLNMLSSQIAISIENAQLYENLEEKVRERTIALEKSHKELEKSHKKITDSVNYASRIQKAVLPSKTKIGELLPDHFILYQPCAVVSGDFYWVKKIEGSIVAAAADCTGHGVSGALVSMQGMAFLNEIVPALAAKGNLTAGRILDVLREKTKTAFKESGGMWHQKEGMDISLCIINPGKTKIQYAGAYNPLYLIRKGDLMEIKADRMPVGTYLKERPFTNHEIALENGDTLYLFTDGFTDQINKASGKKFNKTRLKKLLTQIYRESMDLQRDVLMKRFDQWREGFPQVDDTLIFGIRI